MAGLYPCGNSHYTTSGASGAIHRLLCKKNWCWLYQQLCSCHSLALNSIIVISFCTDFSWSKMHLDRAISSHDVDAACQSCNCSKSLHHIRADQNDVSPASHLPSCSLCSSKSYGTNLDRIQRKSKSGHHSVWTRSTSNDRSEEQNVSNSTVDQSLSGYILTNLYQPPVQKGSIWRPSSLPAPNQEAVGCDSVKRQSGHSATSEDSKQPSICQEDGNEKLNGEN